MNCVFGADEFLDFIKPSFNDELELFEFFKQIILNREISR